MDLLFMKICICSACFGWGFVDKLTNRDGLFEWLPRYYPKALNRLLTCSYCVSGWVSMIAVLAFYQVFGLWTILNFFTAPFCTMALVGVVIQINTFYNDFKYN